jgi:zinc/manganese transport system ATP-binding protein
MMAMCVVRLEGVGVRFESTEALAGVTVSIDGAAHTVIVGPNGAGKSTLLDVIAGVRAPSEGSAHRTATTVAFVPQRAAVPDALPVSVRDVVTMGAWGRVGPWRRLGSEDRARVDAALQRLDITALARRRFASLSGGQRQRALLAQGLARGADLLLLDEPTTGLDAASALRIRAVIAEEAERGTAVVCVSHDDELIAEADRVVRLADGRIAGDERARHAERSPT